MMKPFYYFSKILFNCCRPIYRNKIIGKENITKEPCIYACNHLSSVDIGITQVHVPGYKRYIGKREYAQKGFSNFCLRHFGVIFIDRDKPELSAMREVFNVLKDGQIFIFPEGTRNKGNEKEMLPIKGGLALFAAKSGVPVVPMMVYRRPKKFRKNYIYIGKPLDVCGKYKGKMPNAEAIEAITKIYEYEFAKLRVIIDDYVENKRWKKKNRLPEGVEPEALTKWKEEHPAPPSVDD